MKKLLLAVMLAMFSIVSNAQKDVTKFLGIPVDGSKAAMIHNLKAKGFTSDPDKENVLIGEFNGQKVYVYVVTNNNKVYRIMVADADYISETDIKIRFNTLCGQFKNNGKYMFGPDQTISENENISYNMSANNKRYEADFYQADSATVMNEIQEDLLKKKYTKEQIANFTEEIESFVMLYLKKRIDNKSVWFMIEKHNVYDKFRILMFYDNKYNQAHGQDL